MKNFKLNDNLYYNRYSQEDSYVHNVVYIDTEYALLKVIGSFWPSHRNPIKVDLIELYKTYNKCKPERKPKHLNSF